MSFVFFILSFLFLFFFAWLFSFICSVLFPYFFHACPCPKLKRGNNPGPLHVGYRIRALYLGERDTCQLASSSYVVVFFSPCTCFRVHLPSLLCYSLPRSFFLFVSSVLFPVLLYFLVTSLPSLAKVNGQWHGGKMGTPACDADYTHYITSLPLSPHFNRCNFLSLSLFFFLLHFCFQLPPTCSFPRFYSLSLYASLFLFVLALFIFLAHTPILSNVFLVLVFTRRNEITKRKREDENGTHTHTMWNRKMNIGYAKDK